VSAASDGDILGAHFSRFLVPRIVTDRLGNDTATLLLKVSASQDVVRNAAESLARSMGLVIHSEPDVVVTKVGTGLFGLNPAVLRLRFAEDAGTTTIEVSATAKEGLIKQHGGHQATEDFAKRFLHLTPKEWGV